MYLTVDEFLKYFPGVAIPELVGTPAIKDNTGRIIGYEPVLNDDIQPFIDSAESEVEAHIGQRYELPLNIVPPILKQSIADIARYRLYKDRATDAITTRYDQAINFLKSVAGGRASLGPGVTLLGSATSSAVVGIGRPGGGRYAISAPTRNLQNIEGF